jgi:acetyltransferase
MDKSKLPTLDPVHDVLHYEKKALDVLFAPKNVAVIGATETPPELSVEPCFGI